MKHSPFANRSRALTFVTVTVLGGLFIADSVDDVSDGPAQSEAPTRIAQPDPAATIASNAASEAASAWEREEETSVGPDIEIGDYRPPQRSQVARVSTPEAPFTGRRPIPDLDDRIVR